MTHCGITNQKIRWTWKPPERRGAPLLTRKDTFKSWPHVHRTSPRFSGFEECFWNVQRPFFSPFTLDLSFSNNPTSRRSMDDSMSDCPRNREKLLFLYFNFVYSLGEKTNYLNYFSSIPTNAHNIYTLKSTKIYINPLAYTDVSETARLASSINTQPAVRRNSETNPTSQHNRGMYWSQ